MSPPNACNWGILPKSATAFPVLSEKFSCSVMRDVIFSSIREFYPDAAAHFICKHREKMAAKAAAQGATAQWPLCCSEWQRILPQRTARLFLLTFQLYATFRKARTRRNRPLLPPRSSHLPAQPGQTQ